MVAEAVIVRVEGMGGFVGRSVKPVVEAGREAAIVAAVAAHGRHTSEG